MKSLDLLGLVAGSLTTFAFVPQVVRTWRTRSTHDLSMGWIATFLGGVIAWLAYGIVLGAWPIIAANVVTLGLVLSLLVMKLSWR